MKQWIHNSDNLKTFKYPDDISEIEKYVADNYSLENGILCKEICEGLSHKYSNLKSVRIDYMWIDRHIERGLHYVCKVTGSVRNGCDLIDPTGDQYRGRLSNMRCASFHKNEIGYLSNNYIPIVDGEISSFEFHLNYPDGTLITLEEEV